MALDYQVEIRGVLPKAVRQELCGRFGAITVDRRGIAPSSPACKPTKPALPAVLRLLWDVGSELRLVKAVDTGEEEKS